MAGADAPDDVTKIASHTLAYLRALDKKMDLVLETQARHTERLGRVERGIDEVRRDLAETKSDIVLVENRILSAQTDILTILHRLQQAAVPSPEDADSAAPTPAGSE
jgi:predicted  nucleic acid-binding Zn-ribbon protein